MSRADASPTVPVFGLRMEPEDVEAAMDVLRSGWLTMGPRTQAFEETFAAHLGVRHGVMVNSCTAALHLAYLAAGVGPGDEVIVPSLTFVATGAAAIYCGATPVFAEVEGPHQPTIDPDHVERLIGPRTKAVCVVHFAGYPAAVERVRAICDAHGVALIEDAAHSPSAHVGGRKLGAWGLAGAFSFFSNKVLAAGEGGLLATDDDEVAAFARSRRSHGMSSGSWSRYTRQADEYDAEGLGFNYRPDEVRAALLLSRFARLEPEIEERRALTRRYRALLDAVDGVTTPFGDADVERSTCYVMPILVDPRRRDAVRRSLRDEHGIQTSVFYPSMHRFSAMRDRFGECRLPRTEHVSDAEITIPLYLGMGEETQVRVVTALEEALQP